MAKKDASNLWGIVLDGPPTYQRMVAEILRGKPPVPGGIAANPVGRVILEAIASRSQTLTIMRSSAMCNAGTHPDGPENDAHPSAQRYYLGHDNDPKTLRNDRFDESKSNGTGKGVSSNIEYSPGVSSCRGGPNSFEPDQVLLHELVHALREMQGLENSVPLDATFIPEYGDSEEWLAIQVENVYQSAKGRTEFRGAWDATTKLKPPENTPEGFLADPTHRSMMKDLYLHWRPLFGNLSLVLTKFNPFRTYTLDPVKYGQRPLERRRA